MCDAIDLADVVTRTWRLVTYLLAERHSMLSGHNAPVGARHLPDDTLEDELSTEAEQWARDDAIVRADFLRCRFAKIDDRRQFGNPIAMHDMQRVMSAWTKLASEVRAS